MWLSSTDRGEHNRRLIHEIMNPGFIICQIFGTDTFLLQPVNVLRQTQQVYD